MPEGTPALGWRGRVDQVADGFGLYQVQLAVEHGAAGEFSGVGGAGACGMQRRQQLGGHEQAAMAAELDQVLTGVARRRREDEVEAPVDRRAVTATKADNRAARAGNAVNPAMTLAATSNAPAPESRITASAARPGAVASAAMGSESIQVRSGPET